MTTNLWTKYMPVSTCAISALMPNDENFPGIRCGKQTHTFSFVNYIRMWREGCKK